MVTILDVNYGIDAVRNRKILALTLYIDNKLLLTIRLVVILHTEHYLLEQTLHG